MQDSKLSELAPFKATTIETVPGGTVHVEMQYQDPVTQSGVCIVKSPEVSNIEEAELFLQAFRPWEEALTIAWRIGLEHHNYAALFNLAMSQPAGHA
jgi:hypothetical protein